MKHNPVKILTVDMAYQEGKVFLRDAGRNVVHAGVTGRGKRCLLADMPAGNAVSRRLLTDDMTSFMTGGQGN
ncbi:hypothetical protein [Kosakonia pseudosacchari]|uniref:hypothetical protein n=1 Tax=Kosakonia pseudosacchari TaxID=1646340 RepID=UPI001881BF3B|nr:hypothetical protein [Kosakonia pseudosacchari]QOV66480.1 hypothetical protein IP581_23325 [Kosakonia pseudosacchari]